MAMENPSFTGDCPIKTSIYCFFFSHVWLPEGKSPLTPLYPCYLFILDPNYASLSHYSIGGYINIDYYHYYIVIPTIPLITITGYWSLLYNSPLIDHNYQRPISTWAVFKIPLSFHYTVFWGFPVLGYWIPQLTINQQGFWTLLTC